MPASPTPFLEDALVESTARLLCRDLGLDPDVIVTIAGAEAVVDGISQPVEMTGPQWMAHAVEASRMIVDVGKRMAAQFVREVGHG